MASAMRSLLEAGPSPETVRKAREQLVLLCQSYMTAATAKRVEHSPRLLATALLNINARSFVIRKLARNGFDETNGTSPRSRLRDNVVGVRLKT